MPGEWSLLVPLHKSLDLSLLTHRDPFAVHCCPLGPFRWTPVTYVDASTIFSDL
ncbi:hypothetical protein WN51_11880 [Melipona quadrifasciata]|uniref:Uncharacterized protein n=1 Tax=Melipona quadrifasciata TaxID=166423 RepID=A0A0N0U619_9HYME|nr:hypothetical protein WN51_11880 [Melipona quadrifasciata]